jgi:predicted O-methyltransferase YrrM
MKHKLEFVKISDQHLFAGVGFGGNIFIEKTDDFFLHFKDKVDMIFIDADHSYESAKKDLLNSLNILSESGIILIHDTDPEDNRLFSHGYCGDSYKIVSFIEDSMHDLNVVTIPIAEAGISVISRKKSTRTFLRNKYE